MSEGAALIRLRPITVADATPHYLKWMNDEEVTRFLSTWDRRYTLGEIRDYLTNILANSSERMFAITDGSSHHVGNIKIHIDRQHNTGDIGLLIGEKSCWGRGYATAAILAATRIG